MLIYEPHKAFMCELKWCKSYNLSRRNLAHPVFRISIQSYKHAVLASSEWTSLSQPKEIDYQFNCVVFSSTAYYLLIHCYIDVSASNLSSFDISSMIYQHIFLIVFSLYIFCFILNGFSRNE